jgi:hypothetical protein
MTVRFLVHVRHRDDENHHEQDHTGSDSPAGVRIRGHVTIDLLHS